MLRDGFLAGSIGNVKYAIFVPVVDASHKRYELYVRDASPFEGDDGLIPLGVF